MTVGKTRKITLKKNSSYRSQLFDIRFLIVKIVTYLLIASTFALLYTGLFLLASLLFEGGLVVGSSQIISGLAASYILAITFMPIKNFYESIIINAFYHNSIDFETFYSRLSDALTSTNNLRTLLEKISYEIKQTLFSEQAFFYIRTDETHFMFAGADDYRKMPKSDAETILSLVGNNKLINFNELLDDNLIKRIMVSHRIHVILPLFHDKKPIGILCLGEHMSSDYDNRDFRALNAIGDELVIAIENALSVQKIRDLNETLKQRIANATRELRASNADLRQLDKTKDEFVSMASHQLRTPLTSVKGYISMLLEGDAGKINETQKQFLTEAFNSSERMVRLISDFLDVSRIQTGKFVIDRRPVDMINLVEQELDGLQPNATSRNLKFNFKKPKSIPEISVDENKIRQVIMNFADNALYYSKEDTTINVILESDDKNIIFKVVDIGIGVSKAEQAHLFTKFFRAENAKKQRPDGTGVGLYLAKKVIDGHDGKIIFESVERQGSTFGFSLPIS